MHANPSLERAAVILMQPHVSPQAVNVGGLVDAKVAQEPDAQVHCTHMSLSALCRSLDPGALVAGEGSSTMYIFLCGF